MKKFDAELARISKLPSTQQQIVLAALLSKRFERHGMTLIVVGGAAVQYYTNAQYTTHDVDAILWGDDKDIINQVMAELGFKRTPSYRHFEHPYFRFVVEFPPSPIEVGGRYIDDVNLLRLDKYTVRVIKIEDILMDRIIAGIAWKSSNSLAQARLLWLKNRKQIDLAYLTDFAEKEGCLVTLREVIKTDTKRGKIIKK